MTAVAIPRDSVGRRIWQNRPARWIGATLAVALLVLVTIAVFQGSVGRQRAEDPRSSTRQGAGALGQLLSTEGIRISTAGRVAEASERLDASTTLVVARPDQLTATEARQLMDRHPTRVILLRPPAGALEAFGAQVEATPPRAGVFQPDCLLDAAALAGPIEVDDPVAGYRPTGLIEAACYPTGTGYAYLRVAGTLGTLDLVGGGLSNAAIGKEGNAAFAMNLLGTQPQLVWLMATHTREAGGSAGGGTQPTLLPRWWQIGIVQAAVALATILRAGQTPGSGLVNGTTTDPANASATQPAVLLTPYWTDIKNMEATVITDKFVDVTKLCAAVGADVCTAAGIH